jgi:hypothetical protein
VIEAHFSAVKERLEEHVALAGKVHDTALLNPDGSYTRTNYVILFGGAPGELGGDRLARTQVVEDNAVFDYMLRAVGVSADVPRNLIDAISAQLTGWKPVVVGRRCSPMHYPPGQRPEVRVETSVKPPLFYADVEWTLRSHFVNGGS